MIGKYVKKEEEKKIWMQRFMKIKHEEVRPVWSDEWRMLRINEMMKDMMPYFMYEDVDNIVVQTMKDIFGSEWKKNEKRIMTEDYKATDDEKVERVNRLRLYSSVRVQYGVPLETGIEIGDEKGVLTRAGRDNFRIAEKVVKESIALSNSIVKKQLEESQIERSKDTAINISITPSIPISDGTGALRLGSIRPIEGRDSKSSSSSSSSSSSKTELALHTSQTVGISSSSITPSQSSSSSSSSSFR